MSQPIFSFALKTNIEPLCPRDNKVMRYEASGLPSGTDNRPCYHCGFEGCGVRYDEANGYFILKGAPHRITPVAEPGVNTLKCAKHGAWMYLQRNEETEPESTWCCGVEGCHHFTLVEMKGNRIQAQESEFG